MTTQTDQEWLNQKYNETFGRDASFGTSGGADYWLDQMSSNPTSHNRDEVLRMLQGSQEGQKYAASVAAGNPTVKIGGLESDLSTHSQGQKTFADGTANPNYNVWAGHFQDGGSLQGGSSAAAANAIAAATGQPGNFFQQADADIISKLDTQGTNVLTGDDATAAQDGWWNQFADADAFKAFLQGDQTQGSGGMDDFMKFMMLMSVMGGKGGGGGYGGSQYGYGGLNPGGVMQAYDPLAQLQGMGSWFKDNFGSGGASSATINAT